MNHIFDAKPQKQSSTPLVGGVLRRKCDMCREKEPVLERTDLHPAPDVIPPIVHDVLKSPGQPIDPDIRAFMEPRFRHDFSRVRVHTDTKAAESAGAVNAQAYTVGKDIVFGERQYDPKTVDGRKLLAHELVHTVQQRRSAFPMAPTINRQGDCAEREAKRLAETIQTGKLEVVSSVSERLALYRQTGVKTARANRFLPNEKAQLRRLGRGELNGLIDQIIADGAFHQVQQETINGTVHIWEVKTVIDELSEEEQMLEGPKYGGAIGPETKVTGSDGIVRHQLMFILRGGRVSTIESALHELIHLRIMIDRSLPPDKQSSFFNEYAQLNEMTEVAEGAKLGAVPTIGQKSNYGALPIITGIWEKEKTVLEKINRIRAFLVGQDANAEAAFNSNPELTPRALIEFVVQEKYVTQTATKAVRGNAANNETVATRYAKSVVGKFRASMSKKALERIDSSIGKQMLTDITDELRLSIRRMYDELDQQLRQAREFEQNPPAAPPKMPNPAVFESTPIEIGEKTGLS